MEEPEQGAPPREIDDGRSEQVATVLTLETRRPEGTSTRIGTEVSVVGYDSRPPPKGSRFSVRESGWRLPPAREIIQADALARGPICGQEQAVGALRSAPACCWSWCIVSLPVAGAIVLCAAVVAVLLMTAVRRRLTAPLLNEPARGTPMITIVGTAFAVLLAFITLAAFRHITGRRRAPRQRPLPS
jgi:hypothetical protein